MRRNQIVREAVLGATIALLGSFSFAAGQQAPQVLDDKTAAQVYKNIRVLTDVPADQITPSMHLIKASVGLDCEDCHIDGNFPADAKPTKIIARQMMQMVIDLNKSSFLGQPKVTCYTCHRGSPTPATIPLLPVIETAKPEKVALPSVDQILARYTEALGGEQAIRKVTTRLITGTQYIPTGPGGVVPMPAAIERDSKAPNLAVNIYRTPGYTIADGFDGSTAWTENAQGRVVDAGRIDERRARRAADFYEPLNLKNEYAELNVTGIERVDDRDAYVIVARPDGDLPERLYFDVQTGLLLRKWSSLQTPTGNCPFQVSYSDYRDTGSGVKFPFVIRMNPAGPRLELGTTATILITKVQDNVAIDDGKFAKPPSPAVSQKTSAQ